MEQKTRRKKRSHAGAIIAMLVFMGMILGSVALLFLPEQETQKTQPTPTPGVTASPTQTPEQSLLAVVLAVDTTEKTVRVYDTEAEQELLLVYTGASEFRNGYDTRITAAQLSAGDLLDIELIPKEQRIVSAVTSKQAWKKTKVSDPVVTEEEHRISFRGQNYRYSDGVCVMSNGEKIALTEVSRLDELTFYGVDTKVVEIVVTRGHGQIALTNHEDFIGGTIAIGNGIVTTVTAEGIYAVKEGTYEVTITKGSYTGTETIAVGRGETAEFDVYVYGRGSVQTGLVVFRIEPLGANLYLDGVRTSYYDRELELPYGDHRIEVTEGGYLSYEAVLTVDRPKMQLDIYLTEASVSPTPDPTDPTTDSTEITPTPTPTPRPAQTTVNATKIAADSGLTVEEGHAIWINGPEGASVLLNGQELGTAPLDFEKIIGTFIITVIKENGEVKNFNCTETANGEDSYYNFDW